MDNVRTVAAYTDMSEDVYLNEKRIGYIYPLPYGTDQWGWKARKAGFGGEGASKDEAIKYVIQDHRQMMEDLWYRINSMIADYEEFEKFETPEM